jgi:hypothetical protein
VRTDKSDGESIRAQDPTRGGEPTRERVRSTIGQVGGYWRPLAALARLQEELGELAELLALARSSDIDSGVDRCASELADLWIITTALSDQFLGAVAEPGSYSLGSRSARERLGGERLGGERLGGKRLGGKRLGGEPLGGEPLEGKSLGGGPLGGGPLGDLLAASGRIARIVNYYDGPKTPRSFDDWTPLSSAVADFHRSLARMSSAHGIDLAAAVNEKLDAIPALDSGRFRSGEHDPATAASLERFRALQMSLDLDEHAHLWGSPECSLDFDSSVRVIAADLTSFTKASAWERLDAYLISGPSFSSKGLLDEWLTRLLLAISACDPSGGERATTGPIEGAEPYFAFNGLRLLVSVLDAPSSAGTFALLEPSTRGRPTRAMIA